MKLQLSIDGTPAAIELLSAAPACRFRLDGGPERAADVEQPEPCVYSVLMEGRSYEARVEPAPCRLIVTVAGHRFEIEVADPRRWDGAGVRAAGSGVETVVSPMPGKVVRVLAAPGDMVEAGQGIVVVEAMKMQNEMKTRRAGRVAAVYAREGASVAAGETLAAIE